MLRHLVRVLLQFELPQQLKDSPFVQILGSFLWLLQVKRHSNIEQMVGGEASLFLKLRQCSLGVALKVTLNVDVSLEVISHLI